jgi:purine-binding chemotaxis protein CheW
VCRNLGALFALPITYVEEVVQLTEFQSLPEEIWGVVGIVDYHGIIIAVVDFGQLLSAKRSPLSRDSVFVICSLDSRKLALVVNEASDVVTISNEEIQMADEVLPGVLNATGLIKVEDETVIIVDALSIALSVQLDGLQYHDRLSNRVQPEVQEDR